MLDELNGLAKDDPDRVTSPSNFKRRKGQEGQAIATGSEASSTDLNRKSNSGSAKSAKPEVDAKKRAAADFLEKFEVPTNPENAQKDALVVVCKNFRGDYRKKVSSMKAPKTPLDPCEVERQNERLLREAVTEVAEFLVMYYNKPYSSWEVLQRVVTKKGPACIRYIRDWLAEGGKEGLPFKTVTDEVVIHSIFNHFQQTIEYLG